MSETNASLSERNSATSESNAKTYADNASASASSAQSSASTAVNAANSASSSATAAGKSETNAASYAEQALQAASDAEAVTNVKTMVGATDTTAGIGGLTPTPLKGSQDKFLGGDAKYHTINKTTLGLDNVDNTADTDKPVSTVQQEALDGVEARLNAKIDSHISEIEKKITLSYSSVKEV